MTPRSRSRACLQIGGQLGPEGAEQIVAGAPAYFEIEAEYGTPAIDADEIASLPEVLRQQADLVLGVALPLEASTAGDPPPGDARPSSRGALRPLLPAVRWSILAGAADAVVRVGLFADEPSFPVPIDAGGAHVTLPDVGRRPRVEASGRGRATGHCLRFVMRCSDH